MPALPWRARAPVSANQEYLAMATFLPLRSYRAMPRFLRLATSVTGQLERTGGLVGYSLLAQPARKRFWTLSVWIDRRALSAFVREMPHLGAMQQLRPHMGPTRFTAWTVLGCALPISWNEATERLMSPDASSTGGEP
jgi:heme-degrading monooxygenase HmoA